MYVSLRTATPGRPGTPDTVDPAGADPLSGADSADARVRDRARLDPAAAVDCAAHPDAIAHTDCTGTPDDIHAARVRDTKPATLDATAATPVPLTARARWRRRFRGVPGTVLALGVVSMLTDVSSESVGAVLPLYLTAVLGMSPLAYGFLEGIYQGVSALVRLLGGWWADSTRRPKWVAFTGYLASALSRPGLLLAGGFGSLSAVVTVDRLGKGLRTGPRDAMIAAASPAHQLGRNFGVHRMLDTAGALAGPLVAFAVLWAIPAGGGHLAGYRAVFAVSAAFALVGVVVLALFVPDVRRPAWTTAARRAKPAGAAADPSSGPHVRRVPDARAARAARRVPLRFRDLFRPGLRRILLAAGVLAALTVGDGFLYLMLAKGGGLSAEYFPLLFVGTNAAYLALAIPAGRLADRLGRNRVFVAGHVLLLAAYAFALGSELATPRLILVLFLLGAFYACTDGVLAALASQAVPTSHRATGIAAAQTVVAVARFASAIAFGLLWQLFGAGTALVVMGAGLLVALPCAAVLLGVRATHRAV